MTVYGTPGSTPLNTPPFQGTTPGNAVGPTLQTANPGVGYFPPNSDNRSGDTVLAACSRGALPINVVATNFGQSGVSGGGRAISSSMSSAGSRGAGPGFQANGGSASNAANGGGGLGAGGSNQQQSPSSGAVTMIPAAAPATLPTLAANPNFRG